jgi:hypothetical protein
MIFSNTVACFKLNVWRVSSKKEQFTESNQNSVNFIQHIL